MTAQNSNPVQSLINRLNEGSIQDISVPTELSGKQQANELADAIRNCKLVMNFSMDWGDRIADEFKPIFEALAEKTTLRSISINGNWLRDNHTDSVTAIIRNNPYLDSFAAADTGLTAKGVSNITDALKEKEHLLVANFSNNILGDEGANSLAQLLEHCPRLGEISATDCEIGDEGIASITKAIEGNKTLCSLQLGSNAYSQQASEALAQTILENQSHNFHQVRLDYSHEALTELCRNNKVKISKASELLEESYVEQDPPLEQLYAEDIKFIHTYLPAILYNDDIPLAGETFYEMLNDMPPVPQGDALTLESLTAPNNYGHCVLDHPDNWQEFSSLAEKLAENGTPISREFMQSTNNNRETFLNIGLTHAPEAVMAVLNQSGIQIRKQDLLLADGKPNANCNTLMRYDAIDAVFSLENWKDATPQELQDTYRALPQKAQNQVSNYHSLSAALSNLRQPSTGRGR